MRVRVGRYVYEVRLEEDFDGGYAVFVMGNLIADFEQRPTTEQLQQAILDNIKLENTIKTGLAQSGVFA